MLHIYLPMMQHMGHCVTHDVGFPDYVGKWNFSSWFLNEPGRGGSAWLGAYSRPSHAGLLFFINAAYVRSCNHRWFPGLVFTCVSDASWKMLFESLSVVGLKFLF